MKQTIIQFTLMICILVFTSCSNQEKYSCDEEINDWVVENLSAIKSMSRSAWTSLPEDLKAPTFGAFDKEQKIKFWNEKLNTISKLDWNKQEQLHIQKLLIMIQSHPEWFDIENRTEAIEDEMYICAYEWINYATENLHWDSNLIGGIAASGNDLKDKSGMLKVSNANFREMYETRSENCNCNQTYDFCSGIEDTCGSSSCTEVNYCGWLLLSKCDGSCHM